MYVLWPISKGFPQTRCVLAVLLPVHLAPLGQLELFWNQEVLRHLTVLDMDPQTVVPPPPCSPRPLVP